MATKQKSGWDIFTETVRRKLAETTSSAQAKATGTTRGTTTTGTTVKRYGAGTKDSAASQGTNGTGDTGTQKKTGSNSREKTEWEKFLEEQQKKMAGGKSGIQTGLSLEQYRNTSPAQRMGLIAQNLTGNNGISAGQSAGQSAGKSAGKSTGKSTAGEILEQYDAGTDVENTRANGKGTGSKSAGGMDTSSLLSLGRGPIASDTQPEHLELRPMSVSDRRNDRFCHQQG